MGHMASDLVPTCVEALDKGLRSSGFRSLARVLGTARATDVAVALHTGRVAVIRCVDHAATADHTALATMLAEGDFVWAGLVYGEREGSETVGLVETFHVSELDRLVSRLLELREAFGEAG
jgi:hypothetical protein